MIICLLLKHEDLEGVMIGPGCDLGSVETVECVHLAKDVPHHPRLWELQCDVALPLLYVFAPHHREDVWFTSFLELLVQLSHHSQGRSQTGGLGQEVQHEPEVPVLVVDLVQLPQQLLGARLSPLHLGCGLELALVAPHEAGQLPPAGTEEVHQGEEGGEEEQEEQGHRHYQHVQVELDIIKINYFDLL